ncbi:MAG: hypothetical protein IPP55_17990 [Anaerolineales bacterium]|nr:hypothetical protein [Anaerolineales bacterium]
MTSFGRTHLYGGFIDIARKQWLSIQASIEKLPELREKLSQLTGDDANYFEYNEIDPIELEINSSCCIIIVMSALAAEGYIYDYAARNLSDSFVDDIEKLDIVSKWVFIHQLVTGKRFPKDGKAYQLLKQLVSDRNYLAHSKSAPALVYDEKNNDWSLGSKANRMREFSESLFDKAKNALSAIDELSLVIENLDPNEQASFHLSSPVGKWKAKDKYG